MKRRRKHWYYVTSFYCPLCGRVDTYRERRYTRRPKRWENRHCLTESWDYCGI